MKLKIEAMGYQPYAAIVNFDKTAGTKPTDPSAAPYSAIKDLGNFKLKLLDKELQNVTVVATRPLLEMYLDRKVYNVEKDMAATGGTALDIMKNVPSVVVDLDGNVTLRNAAPQIFVDGRPTALTLEQIPADQVASVEIITNPSAKYDAGGAGAGILNILLKKTKKAGYNGNLKTNIDSRGMPGFGGDINLRQNKINFFASAQHNSRKNINTVTTRRSDFTGRDTVNTLQQNGPILKGYFSFGRAGLDYFIDNRTTITLTGNLFKGKFTNNDLLNIYRDTIKRYRVVSESAQRSLDADVLIENRGLIVGLKHNFPKEGRELTADINLNKSYNSNTSNYGSRFFDAMGNQKPLTGAERAVGGGNTKYLTFQTDYVNTLAKKQKIETGIRIATRNYSSWNDNFIQDVTTMNYWLIPSLTVNYNFDDAVYATYVTYSQQLKSFNFQAGLRVESSKYDGNLTSKNQRFSNKYPLSLFPSLFLSKKLSTTQDFQINYSRKINRPGFLQILPFVDFSDSINLSVGNPDLQPEFTNLGEINYLKQYKAGHSFIASVYGKFTDNLITRYQYKAPNTNLTRTDSVIYHSYANANFSYTIGLEITGKNKITSWWDITTNLNLFNVVLKGNNITAVANNELFSWFAKMNNSFSLPKKYSIQLTGEYQAKTILPVNSGRSNVSGGMYGQSQNVAQGFIKPIYGIDIALKKEFLKNNAASLTLQFNDIFRSRTFETFAESAFFNQDNYRQRDPQVVRLNFNWHFGKFDVALFKRKNMKVENEGMQGMGQ